MKHRLVVVLIFTMVLAGFVRGFKPVSESSKPLDESLQVSVQPYDFRIVRSNINLRHGDAGFITIAGQPGETYTIKTYYNIRAQRIGVTQIRVAGNNGEATFNWVVSTETDSGTYSGTITGGGRTLNFNHTVLP